MRRFAENSTANSADNNINLAETGEISASELAKPKWNAEILTSIGTPTMSIGEKISFALAEQREEYQKQLSLPMQPNTIKHSKLNTFLVWMIMLGMIAVGVYLGDYIFKVGENASSAMTAWSMSFPMVGMLAAFSQFQYQKFAKRIIAMGLLTGIAQIVLPIPFWISLPLLVAGSILNSYLTNIMQILDSGFPIDRDKFRRNDDSGGSGELGGAIVKVAAALEETQEKIKGILSQKNISYSYIFESVLGNWASEVRGAEICVIDLDSAKTEEDRLLQLRALQQVEEYKRNNPSKNIVSLIINQNNLSAKDMEQLLGVSNVLSVVKSPNEAVEELKQFNQSNGSFSLRIVTTNQGYSVWINLLENKAEIWNLKFLIPQLIDVGKEVSISLVELENISPSIKTWVENLSSEASIEIEGGKLTIRGVPLEPPSAEESQKLNLLFRQQA